VHEATIAMNILSIVSARIASHPGTSARSVSVLIGEFRNVDEESLRFAFDALKQSRVEYQDCDLVVTTSMLMAKCASQNHDYHPEADNFYRCNCGSGMGDILQGQELDVIGCTLVAQTEEIACTK
jgi:hydrogenase nickel insertion protein HypA